MKVIFGKIEYEWKYGSIFLYDSLMSNNPREKIFLNGNGSGINRMVEIRFIDKKNLIKEKEKKPMQV